MSCVREVVEEDEDENEDVDEDEVEDEDKSADTEKESADDTECALMDKDQKLSTVRCNTSWIKSQVIKIIEDVVCSLDTSPYNFTQKIYDEAMKMAKTKISSLKRSNYDYFSVISCLSSGNSSFKDIPVAYPRFHPDRLIYQETPRSAWMFCTRESENTVKQRYLEPVRDFIARELKISSFPSEDEEMDPPPQEPTSPLHNPVISDPTSKRRRYTRPPTCDSLDSSDTDEDENGEIFSRTGSGCDRIDHVPSVVPNGKRQRESDASESSSSSSSFEEIFEESDDDEESCLMSSLSRDKSEQDFLAKVPFILQETSGQMTTIARGALGKGSLFVDARGASLNVVRALLYHNLSLRRQNETEEDAAPCVSGSGEKVIMGAIGKNSMYLRL